jgi:hypothetical protein
MKTLKGNPLRAQLSALLALPLLGLIAPLAQAQNFESYYGEQPANDGGEDVKAVNRGPNKGSIVVGSRRVPNAVEVRATRVDDNGVALWQRAYRIAGSNNSTGNAVVELRDGSGFALTGMVRRSPNLVDTFIYVMRIDCDGRPAWARILPNQAAGNRSVGYDIVEAAGVTGAVSQLIVVGDENLAAPAGGVDGRIVRVTTAGGLVFNRAYSQPNQPMGLRFRALTENKAANGGQPDIVVAGSAGRGNSWNADRRALMFRVTFNGAPVCNAMLGNNDSVNEDYHGITALTLGNFGSESVLVGATQPALAPAGAQSVYLTRFSAGACVPLVQSVWRDVQDGAIAYDVVESPPNTALFPPSIVAAGTIAGTVTQGDGFALTANDANLGPIGGQFRYSTQSPRRENLFAIDNKGSRFVLAGSTFTDWDGTGDNQDFYLVQTDPNKKTQCVRDWAFDWSPVQLPYERFTPPVKTLQGISPVEAPFVDTRDEGYCCQLDPS